jgi:hypothetical protein
MSDFPRNPAVPTHIHTFSKYMLGTPGHVLIGGANNVGNFSWQTNVAVYLPLYLPWPYNVRRVFWVNGANATGNADVGIYTPGGTKLYSSGSTGASGALVPQYVTPSPDLLLGAGPYFLAWTDDSTTSKAYGIDGTLVTALIGRIAGLYQQATALPLPATMTPAAYAAVGAPMIGITNTDSGF